ncbi:phytoene/squalene synthase family protein [Aureimonas populi]|uniref:Phytoene/squalene synthase family protein n=1 Tax=Aureimonas populi TaxID=1701758 RepID=A0ABW5CHZ6_9HYPH|nr:phytoene/squalene synthase family protein [Aureimonas populi]
MATHFAHCEDLVRRNDPDRAVALQFAQADRRQALCALYAFDQETARIREQVSQPLPGEIRLQWWRDRIAEGITGEEEAGQGSPVAAALIETVRRHSLPPEAFERLLEARIFDLYDDPMPSRQAFEGYAGETKSTVIMLAAMILDRKSAAQASDCAGHAGVADLAVEVLGLACVQAGRAQIFIPEELFSAAGTTRSLWAGKPSSVPAVAEAMAALGREHMAAAGRAWESIPRSIRPAFLPGRLAAARMEAAMSALQRGTALAPTGPIRRSWAYWRAMRKGQG